MSLDARLREGLVQALAAVEEQGTTGPRLADDAARLWRRSRRFIEMHLVPQELDLDALELACYAIQLPLRRTRLLPGRRPARVTLRERAEESAELLAGVATGAGEELLERTTQVLQEMPRRSSRLDEARVLADAMNLDDFGITGLVQQALQLARQGEGVLQLSEGLEKRDQYGYWEARLKDGFHFEPVRQIARRRLDDARRAAQLLMKELSEDGPSGSC